MLPLWSWSLAAAEIKSNGESFLGVGFDRSSVIAREKAISEAVERRIFYQWQKSRISPFDGAALSCPPAAAGSAAHFDRNHARLKSFFEWRERASLQAVAEKRLVLRPSFVPSLGVLFFPILKFLGCEVELWVSRDVPMLAFALGKLSSGGVVFGSACHIDGETAVRCAVAECVRKLTFLKSWRASKECSPFIGSAKFWLTPSGLQQALKFLSFEKNAADSVQLPEGAVETYLKELRQGERWICSYWDPRFSLPDMEERVVPLI